MQAFLMYIDDWISSKRIEMMDAAEERGYLRLLMRAAKEPECCLPDDDVQLAIMSMLGSQWYKPTTDKSRRVGSLTSGQKLRECFVVFDGKLRNERLYREYENQQKVREARSKAGGLGGRPKKQIETNSLSNALANDKLNENKENPSRVGFGFKGFSEDSKENKGGDFETRFSVAWDRHKKHRGGVTRRMVAQRLLDVDWEAWDANHIPFCEFWDRTGWQTCSLAMLEWWENGMPLPPPEIVKRGSSRQDEIDRALIAGRG